MDETIETAGYRWWILARSRVWSVLEYSISATQSSRDSSHGPKFRLGLLLNFLISRCKLYYEDLFAQPLKCTAQPSGMKPTCWHIT